MGGIRTNAAWSEGVDALFPELTLVFLSNAHKITQRQRVLPLRI